MRASPGHFEIRPDWLARYDEPAFEPDRPVIDTHHHLYQRKSIRYLLDEYLEDIAGPHDIRASVMVQARAMLRADGPVELQTLGEAEFANGMAAMSASGIYGPCRVAAAFVAHADLMLGSRVREVLEKLVMASGGTTREGGRLSGIRQPLCWDSDTTLLNPAYPTTANMIESPDFIAGFAELARDRKSTRLNSSHIQKSRMPSSA